MNSIVSCVFWLPLSNLLCKSVTIAMHPKTWVWSLMLWFLSLLSCFLPLFVLPAVSLFLSLLLKYLLLRLVLSLALFCTPNPTKTPGPGTPAHFHPLPINSFPSDHQKHMRHHNNMCCLQLWDFKDELQYRVSVTSWDKDWKMLWFKLLNSQMCSISLQSCHSDSHTLTASVNSPLWSLDL